MLGVEEEAGLVRKAIAANPEAYTTVTPRKKSGVEEGLSSEAEIGKISYQVRDPANPQDIQRVEVKDNESLVEALKYLRKHQGGRLLYMRMEAHVE